MLDFNNTFGIITAYCDEKGCNYEEDFESIDGEHCDLDSAITNMKEDGWKITKKDGDWFHSCPMCQSRERETLNTN